MSTNALNTLPLAPLVAEFADHGATTYEQTGFLALHRYGTGAANNIQSQPPAGVTDPVVAQGVRALRQVFERRAGDKKIGDNKRNSDSYKAELRAEAEHGIVRELIGTDHEVRGLESNLVAAEATQYGFTEREPHDAAGATGDAEDRAYLRGLTPEQRVQAIRSDPRLLLAAVRKPLLTGVASDRERAQLNDAWRAFRDSQEPEQAKRIAEFRAKVEWSRGAVQRAAKQLVAELTTDAPTLAAGLDATETLRLARLLTIGRAETRFSLVSDAA